MSEMSGDDVILPGRSSDPTDNLKKKPAKGILKNSSSFEVDDATGRRKEKAKGTKWDEMNIIETLHPANKDYGHMKIDEPKTPFERPSLDDADAVDAEDLASRLTDSKGKPPKALERLSESSEDDDLSPEEKERKKAFESKRKAHYNEYLQAKKLLKELPDDEEEEEEEEETEEHENSDNSPQTSSKGNK